MIPRSVQYHVSDASMKLAIRQNTEQSVHTRLQLQYFPPTIPIKNIHATQQTSQGCTVLVFIRSSFYKMARCAILLVLLNVLCFRGAQAKLMTTWAGSNEQQKQPSWGSAVDATNETNDPANPIVDGVATITDEIITWPVASMIKRKMTRRRLRVHKQSTELEKLRLRRKQELKKK